MSTDIAATDIFWVDMITHNQINRFQTSYYTNQPKAGS